MSTRSLPRGVLPILALASIASSAHAQGWGITAGVTSARVEGGESYQSSHTGLVGGVFYEWVASGTVSIMAQALYAMKGGADQRIPGVSWSHDYVQVPILARGRFGSGRTRPIVFAGPAIAFSVRCEFSDQFSDYSVDCGELESPAAQSEFSGIVGAGLQWTSFDVSIRYELGFTEVIEGSGDKNRSISIMGGYHFTMPY